jgi:hypothetical protein
MESRPSMEARPPALIESIVAALIPPPARESVMGDLLERHRSAWAFAAEAARTLPFVLWSRIRRTSNFVAMPIVGVFMINTFGVGHGGGAMQRGLAPTIAALLAYMLRDAYRSGDGVSTWRQGFFDLLAAASFIAACQALLAILHPSSLMTLGGIGIGVGLLLVLYALRMQNPGIRPPAVYPSAMSLGELRQEITAYEKLVARSARVEIVVALGLVPFFAGTAGLAAGPLTRAGAAITVAGLLFVAFSMRRTLRYPVPSDVDFRLTVALYRDRLEQHCSRLRTMAWWYLAPLFAGPTLIVADGFLVSPQPLVAAAPPLLTQSVVLITVTLGAWQGARALQRRIAALDEIAEKASA